MIELWVLGAAATLAFGVLYLMTTGRTRQLAMWGEAATTAGLGDVRAVALLRGGGLVATAAGREVRFSACSKRTRQEYVSGTEVAIAGHSRLTLCSSNDDSLLLELGSGELCSSGDELFDAVVVAHGPPDVACAVLDSATRTALRELIGGRVPVAGEHVALAARVRVVRGELRAELMDERGGPGAQPLAGALRTLLAISERLDRPADVVARLAHNVGSEPEPRVRLALLRRLAESQPKPELLRELVDRALADESQVVQLWGALKRSDAKSREVLWAIASGEWSDDVCAERALEALGALTDGLPLASLQPILGNALRKRRQRTAQACLLGLGHTGGSAVVEPLARVLAMESGPLAVMAARGLGLSRSAAAEAPLLEALQNHASLPVRVEAAAALGPVGSAAAVLPLREAGESTADSNLRRATRLSVVEIQSRLGGATPGQLSLAETDAAAQAGALSVAEGRETGRLSLVPMEDKPPSRTAR